MNKILTIEIENEIKVVSISQLNLNVTRLSNMTDTNKYYFSILNKVIT